MQVSLRRLLNKYSFETLERRCTSLGAYDKEGNKFTPGARKLVLVGNPNVGKSVIFNALTRLYVDVSNFPGTTQQIACEIGRAHV